MDSLTVSHPAASRNGSSEPSLPAPLSAVVIATLAANVDKLAELRDAKRQLEADERALTALVLESLTRHDLPAFKAERAVATIITRDERTADPAAFVALVGLERATDALRVVLGKAERLVGADDLVRIPAILNSWSDGS
jgi:hypothetical protein